MKRGADSFDGGEPWLIMMGWRPPIWPSPRPYRGDRQVQVICRRETLDCRGLHILPGVIDSQVHLREPGLEHKEDLESGGRAAVMGGVTSVFEMPNTKPLTVTAAALADKVRRASNRMYCDFAFYMGGTRENVADLAAFEKLPGCAGIKVFMGSSTGELLVEDDEGVASILAQINRRAAFHSEDEYVCASAWRTNRRQPRQPSRLARCGSGKALHRTPHPHRKAHRKTHPFLHVSTAEKCRCSPPTRTCDSGSDTSSPDPNFR